MPSPRPHRTASRKKRGPTPLAPQARHQEWNQRVGNHTRGLVAADTVYMAGFAHRHCTHIPRGLMTPVTHGCQSPGKGAPAPRCDQAGVHPLWLQCNAISGTVHSVTSLPSSRMVRRHLSEYGNTALVWEHSCRLGLHRVARSRSPPVSAFGAAAWTQATRNKSWWHPQGQPGAFDKATVVPFLLGGKPRGSGDSKGWVCGSRNVTTNTSAT